MTFESIIQAIGKKPYFQDDAVVIYNADCRDILPLIPDKSVDLVLTDPPYANSDDIDDYSCLDILPTFPSKLQEGAGFYWFTHTSQLVFVLPLLNTILDYQNIVIWNHPDSPTRKNNYREKYDPICFYSKGELKYFDSVTIRQPISELTKERWWKNPTGKKAVAISENKVGSVLGNVITMPTLVGWRQQIEGHYHKWQKPIELINILLIVSSKQGDVILDPFLGSGTTAYCAKKLGRKCIGIEIEEKYCEIAAKRLSQSVMRLEV